MRSCRRNRRGLAEIVGTLMLVVIVVAAATAFAFFVAAYQKQVQAEETATHDRELEALKVVGVSEVLCSSSSPPTTGECENATSSGSFADLSFTVASLDVNPISVTGLFINQHPVVNFTVLSPKPEDPCYVAANDSNSTFGLMPCQPTILPAFGKATFLLNLDDDNPCGGVTTACAICVGYPLSSDCKGYFALGPYSDLFSPTGDILLQFLTGLGNMFTVSFAPPVPVISVFYVSDGSVSVPVFDGLSSYQPPEADNATILWYNWSILPVAGSGAANATCGLSGAYSGAEFECSGLIAGEYSVRLEVTNTDGLLGVTSETYTQT